MHASALLERRMRRRKLRFRVMVLLVLGCSFVQKARHFLPHVEE